MEYLMSKTAFLFPGQASQYVGMGNDIYNSIDEAAKLYDIAEEYFEFSLKDVSFFGPLKDLTETKVTQPAIFVNSVALYRTLSPDIASESIRPLFPPVFSLLKKD
jgi:[acyl-carrier-protein] S-malonyltransferase